MKKFFTFIMLLFCVDCYAADRIFQLNPYLQDAATAWAGVLGGFGAGGEIATQMRATQNSDLLAFGNMVSVIAYNDTSMMMHTAIQHTDMVYSPLTDAVFSRRTANRNIVIGGGLLGAMADYDSNSNSDFKTRTTGATVRARGYVTDGFSLGVGYARTTTETRDTLVDTDAATNSITAFAQYLSPGGFFVGTGLNAGRITWKNDKSVAGVVDDSAYNTDFYSGQFITGVQIGRNRIMVTPHAGVRYLRMTSDSYIDAAAQNFEKWFYGALTTTAGVRAAMNFTAGGLYIRPEVMVGGGYDVISNGTSELGVRVASGAMYDMPVSHPGRTLLNAGAGISVGLSWGQISVRYRMDSRSDYMSHTGMVDLKFVF